MWSWQFKFGAWRPSEPGIYGTLFYPTALAAVQAFDKAAQNLMLGDHYRLLSDGLVIAELKRDHGQRFRVEMKG